MDRNQELFRILEKLSETTVELEMIGMYTHAAAIQMQMINLRKFLEQ